jgi:hypothetical protein
MKIHFRYHTLLAVACLLAARPSTALAQRPVAVTPGWFGRTTNTAAAHSSYGRGGGYPMTVTPGWFGRPTTPARPTQVGPAPIANQPVAPTNPNVVPANLLGPQNSSMSGGSSGGRMHRSTGHAYGPAPHH